ncbi:MAG: hypothetical protein VCD00_20850 [Candidatus Hydrogenedentota bacterium]
MSLFTRVSMSLFATIVITLAAHADASETIELGEAVQEFNAKAQWNPTGNAQPELTSSEVVAAIRGWIVERTPSATDEIYELYQEIAESQMLPAGTELTFTTGWAGYRGYKFRVWWVDLSIKTGEETGYTFRIRDQKISSHKMHDDERILLQGARVSEIPRKSEKNDVE